MKITNNDEIEHKFLVKDIDFVIKNAYKSNTMVQGYLSKNELSTIRIRITDGINAEYGVKGKQIGCSRKEYEHNIPLDSAKEQVESLSIGIIYKTRYTIKNNNKDWEVDVYEGINKGLIVAEIELESEDEKYNIPDFIGDDITNDDSFSNYKLSLKEPKINNLYISDFNELKLHYNKFSTRNKSTLKI